MTAGELELARPPAHPATARLLALLSRNGLLILLCCVAPLVLLEGLGRQVTQDTWLAVVAGREVATHGIPRHDVLTWWTLGRPWVDQQWLAQLLAYALYRAGGMVALGLVHVACSAAALTIPVAFARRSGVQQRPLAWLLVLALVPALSGMSIRSQSFAYVPFVAVLALLAADATRPTRRVYLVVPLLTLWANLHGSVLLGLLFVGFRATFDRRRPRRALLFGGGVAAVFATPYGLGIASYYRQTLLRPEFAHAVSEWQPPTLALGTAPLFLLCAVTVALVARQWQRLNRFSAVAALGLVVFALLAERNSVWLGLGAIVLLAPPLDRELSRRTAAERPWSAVAALTAISLTALTLAVVVARGGAPLERQFPAAAVNALRPSAAKPATKVFANERFADWLLLRLAPLRGKVAYDARFELLRDDQLRRLVAWTDESDAGGVSWRRVSGAATVIVIDPVAEMATLHVLLAERLRVVYRDRFVAIFERQRRLRPQRLDARSRLAEP